MDDTIRAFRDASRLPPLSVCLLLATISFGLLLTRAESSGAPAAHDTSASPASSELQVVHEPEEIRTLRLELARAERLAKESPERAVELLRRAAQQVEAEQPKGELAVEVHAALGRTLDAAGDHDAAIEVWWRMLSMAPRHEEPARSLAASLYASGRPEEARRVAREMLHEEFEPPPSADTASNDDLGGS